MDFQSNETERKPDPSHALIGVGAWSIVLNALIFLVLFSDRSLVRQSTLIAGLAFGNLMQGIYMVWLAAYRLANAVILNSPTTTSACVSMFFPLLYPVASSSESAFLAIGGIERYLAINAPNWFRTNVTGRNMCLISCVVFGYCSLIILVGLFLAVAFDNEVTWQCGAGATFGSLFTVYCNVFNAVGGAVSVVLTLLALIIGLVQIRRMPTLSGDAGMLRKQLQITKTMLVVSFCDLGLVAIPCAMNAMYLADSPGITFIRGPFTFYTNAAYSTVTFFAFLTFNKHFRRATIKLLHVEKAASAMGKAIVKIKKQPNNVFPMADLNG